MAIDDPRPPVDPSEKRRDLTRTVGQYLRYSTIGIQFILAVGLPLAGGIWLDRYAGTLVLFTLLGLVLGFTSGIYIVYGELYGKKHSRQRDERPEGRTEESSTDRSDDDSGDGRS